APRFWEKTSEIDGFRGRDRTDHPPDMLLQFLREMIGGISHISQRHKGNDRFAFHRVWFACDCSLCHRWMADKRVLHLLCSKPMTCHLDDLVRSPEEPEVTFSITHCIVPWIVEPRKPGPVDLTIPLRVIVKSHEHTRPRPLDDKESLLARW